jgi:superfamily II DNA or RNA helicase
MGISPYTGTVQVAWLIEEEHDLKGHGVPLHNGRAQVREFVFTGEDGSETVVSFGSASKTAKRHDRLIQVKAVRMDNGSLDLSTQGEWWKHPGRIESSAEAVKERKQAIAASWSGGINYRSDKNGGIGLRTPQIGALHAIQGYWSVSRKPGIIVMPTGTGKTEVMVATALAVQCETVLVVVPSDALSSQTARKFELLGVLRSIGVVPAHFLFPVVATMRGIPKEDSDLEIFDSCNVIVATMSALSGASHSILNSIADRCTHLFIDEAHHALAATWNDLRKRFSEKLVLQFTATPFRRDGKRMEGEIVYNYPLAKAQAEDYFRPIRFEQVWEWDSDSADSAIAKVAINRLREDLANQHDHILMARAETIHPRANSVRKYLFQIPGSPAGGNPQYNSRASPSYCRYQGSSTSHHCLR